MVLDKVKIYLDGTMLRFESDDPDFKTRSIPTGRVEVEEQGSGFVFTDVVHETLICSVDSFDDVLDAAGSTYGANLEAVIVALNAFLNFKQGGGGAADNIYTADGTLTGFRTLSYGGSDMLFGDILSSNDEPAIYFDVNDTFGSGKGMYLKAGNLAGTSGFLTFTDQGANILFNLTTSDGNLFNVNNSGIAMTAENGADVCNFGLFKTGEASLSASGSIAINGGRTQGRIEYINSANFAPDRSIHKIVALQNCTIDLPDQPDQGTEYIIYSNGFNVTINPFGTQDINGAASLALTGFQSAVLDYAIVGTNGRWLTR